MQEQVHLQSKPNKENGKKMQILFFDKVVDNVVDMLLCDDRCRWPRQCSKPLEVHLQFIE